MEVSHTRRAIWTTVTLIVAMAWPGGAQPRSSPRALENHPKILLGPTRPALVVNADPARLQLLGKIHKVAGNWGGGGCPSIDQMRGLVDAYLATPHPAFPALGSTTPGLSASWSSRDCGTFTCGLVANLQSYRRFLDAFVNGGLLGADAQAALDNSYIFLPDLSNLPVIGTFNGLGLVKQTVRGLPGVQDMDLYAHNGSLPGVRCENAVIRRPDPGIAPVTGAFCQNSNGVIFPAPSALLFEFIDLIANANPGQR